MTEEIIPRPEWQQRVLKEMEELEDKVLKLHKYVESQAFQSLHVVDKSLLLEQLQVMRMYRGILISRTQRF